jgi:hypothetical protein
MTSVSDIKQMMESAKKQIEERKKVLNVNEDRVSAITALQARIQATMGTLGTRGLVTLTQEQISNAQAAEERDRSLNLVIDAEGRTIDKRTGEVVQIQSRVPTLKANIRVQRRELKVLAGKQAEIKEEKPVVEAPIPFLFTKTPAVVDEKPADETGAFFDNRLR